jgi:cytochrome c
VRFASSRVIFASLVIAVTLVSFVWADDSKVDPAAVKAKSVAFDGSFPEGELGNIVKLGQTLIENTSTHPLTKDYVGNALNCTSCHLENGLDPKAASFIGVASAYPAWSPREKRVITLEDEFSTASCEAAMEFGRRWEVARPWPLPPGSHGCRRIHRSR